MDMQNVAKLDIPEGEVRTIHDKDGRLIWGKVSYSVKYKGDTAQNGAPTPSAPVAVQTVTSENVVKICGKNLWGAEEHGSINENTGEDVWNANRWRTVGYIPVESNTAYTLSSNAPSDIWYIFCFYDSGKNFISGVAVYGGSQTQTTPANCEFMRCVVCDTASTKTTERQLELGSTATAYEPYQGQSYEVDLGNIELCKIGTYQDYIYKSGGKWYVHKEVDRKNLNGSEDWALAERSGSNNGVFYIDYNKIGTVGAKNNGAFSNYARFISGYSYLVGQFDTHYSQWRFYAPNNTITLNEWKTNLGATPLVLYYLPATPTDTEITNEALTVQLNTVEQFLTRYGYNATVSGNLPIIIDRTAL